MNISIEESGNKGAAVAREDNTQIGMMTYSIAGTGLIIVDHTEVNDTHKNLGVGLAMLHDVVAMAREKDIKIMPLCPFASAMFKKHEDIRDVLN